MMCKKVLSSIYISLVVFLIGTISKVNATKPVVVWTPKGKIGDRDIPTYMQTAAGTHSILDIISTVNSYLWFGIGFFCFLFMIVNGYKLITAQGDEKKMESAMKGLIGSAIGITVCLLAYIIVNLATKLF